MSSSFAEFRVSSMAPSCSWTSGQQKLPFSEIHIQHPKYSKSSCLHFANVMRIHANMNHWICMIFFLSSFQTVMWLKSCSFKLAKAGYKFRSLAGGGWTGRRDLRRSWKVSVPNKDTTKVSWAQNLSVDTACSFCRVSWHLKGDKTSFEKNETWDYYSTILCIFPEKSVSLSSVRLMPR